MFNKFFVLVGVGAVLSLGLTGCSTMPTTNEICLIENQRVRECLDFCVQGGFQPENRGIYTQSDSPKKSSRNIWSLAVVSVDQRY